VDYELSIHNAFKAEFPYIEIRGCFFHLLQNLKKQIGDAGLMALAKTYSVHYTYN